jgi:outer membrane protein assembly factor BamB
MSKNKTAIAIALLLLATIAVTIFALPEANARDPPWEYITYCYVAPSPPVVGVGQEMLIQFWLNALPPTAAGAWGDRWHFWVDVTKPGGDTETIGGTTGFESDPVGGGYTWYTPTELGTYKIVARFPGQTITGIPGRETHISVGDIYEASTSKPAYFTVQEETVPHYAETPLPTDYWTRPIYDANRGWGNTAMGQWLGGSSYEDMRSKGIPYTTGPESSHILWTTSYWSGGTMGGFGDVAYYNGIAYEGFGSPKLVLEGKAYYPVQTPPRYGWYCIDLYTGETIYYENNTDGTTAMPEFGQVLNFATPNQFGGFPYLWRTSGLGSNTWEMLDAFTGKGICKIKNVHTSGMQFRDSIGSICYVNVVNLGTDEEPNFYMQIWNTTEAIWWRPNYGAQPPKTLIDGTTGIPNTSTGNDYWFWRPGATTVGMSSSGYTTYDGDNGYSMNVSIASLLGPWNQITTTFFIWTIPNTASVRDVIPDEMVIVGANGRNDARGDIEGFFRGISLERPNWGTTLWNTIYHPPKATTDYPNNTYSGDVSFGGLDYESGVFWYTERVTGKIWVYSIDTGQQLWEYEETSPWYYYGTSLTVHKGKAYTISTGGIVNCFNANTGEFYWNWTAPSIGYLETEGLTYSTVSLAFFIDDAVTGRDKLYLHGSTGWAGQTSPIRRDGSIFCIDTSTGEMLWRLMAYPCYANNALSRVVISEGRIIYMDNHDNQIYCIGRGPSATTVSAPQLVPDVGSSVMITGTVTDQTPSGRHNVAGSLDFTLKGTPAIADESMDAWMEYMFHQRPKPTNATGVEVILETIDPNNNFYEIGRTTSDMEGNYGFMFTPEVPGTYQIIARFEGSASYGSSSATTYMGVSEAPQATPTPTPPPPTMTDTYVLGIGAGAIIAIVVVGLVLALMLRKR